MWEWGVHTSHGTPDIRWADQIATHFARRLSAVSPQPSPSPPLQWCEKWRGKSTAINNKITYFAEINAHPDEISAHQKQWFFKGGSTQNRWVWMDDFSKGGSTQNRWLLMGDFSKGGEYTKPMGFDEWFIKGGGVHKTNGFWWVIFQKGEYTKPI